MKTKLAITLLLACLLPAAALAAPPERAASPARDPLRVRGTLAAAPGASSLTVDVETGNRPALQSLLGQSAEQTFAYDSSTEFLLWSHGIPTVVAGTSLHAGDWVRVNVRAAARRVARRHRGDAAGDRRRPRQRAAARRTSRCSSSAAR